MNNQIEWNNLPESLRPKPLLPNEKRTYKVVGSEYRQFHMLEIPTQDDVIDYSTGKSHKIGAIKKLMADGNHLFHTKEVDYHQQTGFSLNGINKADNAIDMFLQVCSFNKNSPLYQEGGKFFELEVVEQKNIEERKAKEDATNGLLKMLDTMSSEQINMLKKSSLSSDKKPNVPLVENDEPSTTKEDVKNAEIEGLIIFDQKKSTWMDEDGGKLFSFKKEVGAGKGKHDKFLNWIGGDGKEFWEKINRA